jgi:ectoine hydroxylase-related dioxygenase (phytanoyl-CoA dioxygenase family)
VSAFWAIDDFTADNGPTEIIPGSHAWGDEAPPGASTAESFRAGSVHEAPDAPGLEPVLMPAGSLMLAMGTLWHRGGANRSRASRLVITPQYCVAWGRQMESMLLAVPPQVVAGYPERVQQLLGYSIHPPFMGHVNGLHPARLLKQ